LLELSEHRNVVCLQGVPARERLSPVDASIIVALVALVGAIVSAVIAVQGQSRATMLANRRDAEAVLARYREPLVGAAYELQGRLYNILVLKFLPKYYVGGDEAQKHYAVQNTLYVIGQYFGWSEILRREIQFLSFSDSKRTRRVADCQRSVVEFFQSDKEALGRPFLIWRGEQRAIGELMIDRDADPPQPIGYATFLDRDEDDFRRWFARLGGDLDEVAKEPNRRLVDLQHALVDLIRELDPKRLRYSDEALQKV
jgi:hypothetical protein